MKRSNIYHNLTIATTAFSTGCVLAVTVFNPNPWVIVALAGLIICTVVTIMGNDEDEAESTDTH